jgi:16S rRNA (cytosine967-C5)-methyltransferase
MPVSPARAAAFEILMRIDTTDAYASEMLHSERFAKLSPADHGLLTELVMGVLRWRGALDAKIAEHLRSPADEVTSRKIPALVAKGATRTWHPSSLSNQALAKLDLEVLTALRLGAYQLLFLDRIPRHAAVNESVELVKRARKRSAAGMVNAVLRKISDPQFSQKRGEVGRPAVDASHPRWLVERWERIYGPEIARKICDFNQAPPQIAVRLSCLPSEVGTVVPRSLQVESPIVVVEQLRAEDLQFEPGKLLTKAAIVTAGDISQTAAFRERRLVIQDEASQLVALLVGRGKSILDCCAAPGGKTRVMAEKNPNATIVAMDLHPRRAALLRRLAPDSNVQVIAGNARHMPFATGFDRILVDAPCSGTGTLARNPEIKWRLTPEDILRLQAYQIEILTAAMKHVAKGGHVIYSTCSLEPEENEAVIEKAVGSESLFKVVDCGEELRRLARDGELIWGDVESLLSGPYLRTIPGVHPCDGFFAAVLHKA